MNKEDPTPPRTLQTPPQNPPAQPDDEDSTSEEEDIPDVWSDELFPLNIIPFSDDDADNQDPDYIVPVLIDSEDSTSSFSDEEEKDPEDNMAAPNNPPAVPPAVSGGQLSSVTPFTGNQGLDGLVYVEAIDRAREQFGSTQVQTARAAVTQGGNAVANWIRGERAAGITFTAWEEDNAVNLRPAFLTRFGPKYTTGGAVAAIADLKQRSGERVRHWRVHLTSTES